MVLIRYRYLMIRQKLQLLANKCRYLHYFHLYVHKVENFIVYKRIISHFPCLSKFALKINLYFPPLDAPGVRMSEVAPKLSHKFHEIFIKIFWTFVVNVSKIFLTFLSKNVFNLSKVSWIVMLYETSILSIYIATKFFQYFNIPITLYWNGKVDSVWGLTLPKIRIIWENASNKSCWALQRSQWAYMSIPPPQEWSHGTQRLPI